jgi:excisionase family DNA binding protein
MISMGRLLSTKQVGEILGMKTESVRHWLRKGRLPAVKIGKGWFVPESKLQAFLAALPTFGPDVTPANGQSPKESDHAEGSNP